MSWLLPSRSSAATAQRLDAVMAAHLLSTQALSQTSHDAKASAIEERERAEAIERDALARVQAQEDRQRRRRAQIEALQGVLERSR